MMFYSAEVNGKKQQQRINLSQDLCDEILFLWENTHSGRPKKKYWLPARRIRKRVCVCEFDIRGTSTKEMFESCVTQWRVIHSLEVISLFAHNLISDNQSCCCFSFLLFVFTSHHEMCNEKHAFAASAYHLTPAIYLSSLSNFAIDESHFTCHRSFSSVMNGLIKI